MTTTKPRRTLSTDPDRELTPLMWEALAAADVLSGIGSWEYASGILGALKAAGLVTPNDGDEFRRYVTTEAGKRRLSERNR